MFRKGTLLTLIVMVACVAAVQIAAAKEGIKVCGEAATLVGETLPGYYERYAAAVEEIDPDSADIAEDFRAAAAKNRELAANSDCAVSEDLGIERYAEVEKLVERILGVDIEIDTAELEQLSTDQLSELIAELERIDVPADFDTQMQILDDTLDRVAEGEINLEALLTT